MTGPSRPSTPAPPHPGEVTPVGAGRAGPGGAGEGYAPPWSTRTARTTGVLYLTMALAGVPAFLLLRPLLFSPGDPGATLSAVVQHEGLARLAVVLELGLVVTQSLTALWWWRLFRGVDPFAAAATAVFGLVNAVAVLVSAAFLATAVRLAGGGDAGPVHLAFTASDALWGVGAVFFGLWLVPMGVCVLRARWRPGPLGHLLVAGGAGYVLSVVLAQVLPGAAALSGALTVPATVAEFAVIAHLLVLGGRPGRPGRR